MMQSNNSQKYYLPYENVRPPRLKPMSQGRHTLWQIAAGLTIGLSLWYLHWRWTVSLNYDAFWFSVAVVAAETFCFVGTLLFYFDIWEEPKTRNIERPNPMKTGGKHVDIFITTYDEAPDLVEDSIIAAKNMRVPDGFVAKLHILDDGGRAPLKQLAMKYGAQYHARADNHGFKAGNLKHAMLCTDGDFIVIADADTRFFPTFLENTLGYFHDPKTAWVQTPHWFYDLPHKGGYVGAWRKWLFPKDPFMSDPLLFFDVIQRRRDRNGASFCCGAASIHRRSAVCDAALNECADDLCATKSVAEVQPFKFHVSEDLFSSLILHGEGKGWKSVYHPQVEAKMLSPWSLDAWISQKLKYASGTLDIFINHAAPWKAHVPWRARLHYLATFMSYLNVLPILVLLMSPVITLLWGKAPIAAYSIDFFVHLLPVLIMSEVATVIACKGHDTASARALSIAGSPYVLRALMHVLRGRRIGFKPTPKTVKSDNEWHFVAWQIVICAILLGALAYGVMQFIAGDSRYGAGLMVVNSFWVLWSVAMFFSVIRLAVWTPPKLGSSYNTEQLS
ncbi:MAG: glycosyltransferase family 2 protein [Planktomarina sp.]